MFFLFGCLFPTPGTKEERIPLSRDFHLPKISLHVACAKKRLARFIFQTTLTIQQSKENTKSLYGCFKVFLKQVSTFNKKAAYFTLRCGIATYQNILTEFITLIF